MRVILTNLSNDLYNNSRLRLNRSAAIHNINEVNSYDFDDLKNTAFYQENRNVLDNPKGMGFWLWKPYIILETMKRMADGDVVVYSDCGIEIIEDLDPLISICTNEQPILLFANGNLTNRAYTKRDCFLLMNSDQNAYHNGLQCDAAFCIFQKSSHTVRFLKDWLMYCCDERIVSDMPNVCGKKNFFGFKGHRHDQSVLSILAIRYGIPLYRQPTQFGNFYKAPPNRVKGEFKCINQQNPRPVDYYSLHPYDNSPYFQLLNHHRSKLVLEEKEVKPMGALEILIVIIKRRWRKMIRWITRT